MPKYQLKVLAIFITLGDKRRNFLIIVDNINLNETFRSENIEFCPVQTYLVFFLRDITANVKPTSLGSNARKMG